MKVLKSFEARKEKLKNSMPKVIMLVMMLKENLTRSNVMRCNNNKHPGFQHLSLEKENKSKVYYPIFHRQQHSELNQLSKAFFKEKKLWRSVILLLRNGWWMPLFHIAILICETLSIMLDQLDLEDDREDDGANNSVENANQNETNQDVAPHLSDEEQLADFEITP
ncbi:hypothetical protein AHAS_Ahas05G0078000 [Arachis hypogaea]